MSSKNRKNMRGFMCRSTAATAVCKVADPRSVVVPRRADRTLVTGDARTTSPNNARYSRLEVASQGPVPSINGAVNMSVKKAGERKKKCGPKSDSKYKEPAASQLVLSDQAFQVVAMRVSLHCQGCAGKVKKQLSRMEGVTSFSIDLENKRVTVMGHVSPVGVLATISKVVIQLGGPLQMKAVNGETTDDELGALLY